MCIRDRLEVYNYYLIIGGMPECVASWIKYRDPERVARIQRELIEVYENDFSRHNGKVNSEMCIRDRPIAPPVRQCCLLIGI